MLVKQNKKFRAFSCLLVEVISENRVFERKVLWTLCVKCVEHCLFLVTAFLQAVTYLCGKLLAQNCLFV